MIFLNFEIRQEFVILGTLFVLHKKNKFTSNYDEKHVGKYAEFD